MAYRRAIAARPKLLQEQHRFTPSLSHIHRGDDDNGDCSSSRVPENRGIGNYFQHRLFGTGSNNLGPFGGSRNLFRDRRFAIPVGYGTNFVRNMSSLGDSPAENIDIMSDLLVDNAAAAAQVAPVVNEVAVAASDSFLPVAAMQYLIDYVHSFTGFNWWASIVLTTILIRWLQLPLMINQLKATSKFTLLRPRLEEIKAEMQSRDMSPTAVAEGQAQMNKLFKEYGVTPFTPLKGILITGPIFICFFFAIRNMAEHMPSFKDGGILWFTDLTTPDSTYILPVLTALTFWITVECNAQEGLEGNPAAATFKNVARIFAALTVPLVATFPKALFCYWITSNLFSLAYGLVIKKPEVKKFLGVPIITQPPSSATKQTPPFSMAEVFKKLQAAREQQLEKFQQQQQSQPGPTDSSSPKPTNLEKFQQQQQSQPGPTDSSSPKPTNQRTPASSVLIQRIKSLEKEVKARKKAKKN